MTTERSVPTTRIGRLAALGRLAGGVAGGMASEGARRLGKGERPSLNDLLLTPANAQRLADRLSEMRGAAMKVGQLLSMDGGNLAPPQLSEILAKLRDNAHHMPLGDVATILKASWGEHWHENFKRFDFKPLASASIGQVHAATLVDGRRVATKIQYPGVRSSIDSDIENVAALLRLFKLLPGEADVSGLLSAAKRQLHAEADYRKEAASIRQFAALLDGDCRFRIPEVMDEFTTSDVLTMQYLEGQPIESLAAKSQAQVAETSAALLELALREVFEWGLVQTDPNFANYLYDPRSRSIQLLDFGATRKYSAQTRASLRSMLAACVEGSDADIHSAAMAVGYLHSEDDKLYRDAVTRLLRTATEPLRHPGGYVFASSDLAKRMQELVIDMRLRKKFVRIPPAEILFLHRKLGGLYLLLSRLRVTLPVSKLAAPYALAPGA
jgi:predicted unusual protein kinase regulating ubiquinone biosynthesis (AarF/ABC1/UbiB family)